jgi:membrane-associated phospholipid phosphatase
VRRDAVNQSDTAISGDRLKRRAPELGRCRYAAVALLAAMTFHAPTARAEGGAGVAPADPPARALHDEMPIDLPLDLGITLGVGAVWATSELLAPTLEPTTCRWCDRTANGADHVNGFDRSVRSALRWGDMRSADTLSNVFSFGLAPLAGFGVGALVAWHDDRLSELPADTLVVAESAVLAVGLDQIAKFSFARQRPDAHARATADPLTPHATGDNLSFFSGHATLAFALATSAGTVASMRGHRLAPVMWACGLALATTGGYLRIAADRHYATDVLVGAAVGSAVGFAVPYLAHRPRAVNNARLAVLPQPGGGVLMLSGMW